MEIYSPDGRIKCIFALNGAEPTYRVEKSGAEIIGPSKLGFRFFGEQDLMQNLKVLRTAITSHDEVIELIWGEDQFIPNCYNELFIELGNSTLNLKLTFRVFDNAVAFRYEINSPRLKRLSLADELTEFNIDPTAAAWCIPAYAENRYEYNYVKTAVSSLTAPVHTPLTIRTKNAYLSLHEAALYDYGSMTLRKNDAGKLQADITPLSDGTRGHLDLPFKTPWRLILIADRAIDLTKNRTMYALNDPPTQDFSWVKTLKFLGIWWAMYVGEWTWAPGENHGATTEHTKEYIDAAVRLGVSGLLIEGWNDGWEGDWLENGPHNNFTAATPDFDLPKVARYAASKNIELVGHHETVGFVDNYEHQLNHAYNFYAANGVRFVKTGYSGSKMVIRGRKEFHHSQLGVRHYQKTVELAAKKHICLDIHEPIKGTGIERTWPNLLTREGARGQEYESGVVTPEHACILPFTRLLAGGMDYTPGLLDLDNEKRRIRTTLTRQLAYFITIYSGMTMAADRPFIYEERFPALWEFIRAVPTNFAKTVPLAGEIGEFYVVARKSRDSENWFIGGVTSETARTVTLNFDFLEHDRYEAVFYRDAPDTDYLKNPFAHQIEKSTLNRGDKKDIFLAPGGGFAAILKPKSPII